MQPYDVKRCPWRQAIQPDNSACCSLLLQVSGVHDQDLCRVGEDVCDSCCQSFPSSPQHFNPVVASQLYRITTEIIHQSGVPGCDHEQASRLNDLATRNVPFDLDQQNLAPSSGGAAAVPQSPLKPSRWRSQIHGWAVGVTTAPRDVETLPQCLDALISAGWKEPRIFVDGEVAISDRYASLPRTVRLPKIGAWPSYYLALAELVMRSPHADAFLLVQDDAVFFPYSGLRAYLESVLWPRRTYGIASLYCARAYTQPRRGWYRFQGAWRWGALAFIFSRQAAQQFLGDSYTVLHRWAKGPRGTRAIDITIGEWARRCRVPVYYPTPSLVQHVGEVSAIWTHGRAFGDRRASWFATSQADLP